MMQNYFQQKFSDKKVQEINEIRFLLPEVIESKKGQSDD